MSKGILPDHWRGLEHTGSWPGRQRERDSHEMNTHLLPAADPRVSNLTQKHQHNQHVQTDLLADTHTHIDIHAHTHTHTHTHTHAHAVGTRLWNYSDTADLRAV